METWQEGESALMRDSWFQRRALESVSEKYGKIAAKEQKETTCALLAIFTSSSCLIYSSSSRWAENYTPILVLFESLLKMENEALYSAVKQESFCNPLFSGIVKHVTGGRKAKSAPSAAFRMASIALSVLSKGSADEGKRVIGFLHKLWQIDVKVFAIFAQVVPVRSMMVASPVYSVIVAEETKHEKRVLALKCIDVLKPMAVALHCENRQSAKPFWHVISELYDSLLMETHDFGNQS